MTKAAYREILRRHRGASPFESRLQAWNSPAPRLTAIVGPSVVVTVCPGDLLFCDRGYALLAAAPQSDSPAYSEIGGLPGEIARDALVAKGAHLRPPNLRLHRRSRPRPCFPARGGSTACSISANARRRGGRERSPGRRDRRYRNATKACRQASSVPESFVPLLVRSRRSQPGQAAPRRASRYGRSAQRDAERGHAQRRCRFEARAQAGKSISRPCCWRGHRRAVESHGKGKPGLGLGPWLRLSDSSHALCPFRPSAHCSFASGARAPRAQVAGLLGDGDSGPAVSWTVDSGQAPDQILRRHRRIEGRCDLDHRAVAWPGGAVISSLPVHALLQLVQGGSEG